MKRILFAAFLSSMLAAAFLSADGKTNKSHLNMKGKDDAKINCVYCHTTAKVPKKKGVELKPFYKSPFCAGKGCHPLAPKVK